MRGQQARLLRLLGVCGGQPGWGAGAVPECRPPGGPLPGAGGLQVVQGGHSRVSCSYCPSCRDDLICRLRRLLADNVRAEGELERFKEQKMEQTLDCNVRLVICLYGVFILLLHWVAIVSPLYYQIHSKFELLRCVFSERQMHVREQK